MWARRWLPAISAIRTCRTQVVDDESLVALLISVHVVSVRKIVQGRDGFPRSAPDGELDGGRLQQQPELEDVVNAGQSDRRHPVALPRADLHEALLHQPSQRLPDGRPAESGALGEGGLPQLLSGAQVTEQDPALEGGVCLIGATAVGTWLGGTCGRKAQDGPRVGLDLPGGERNTVRDTSQSTSRDGPRVTILNGPSPESSREGQGAPHVAPPPRTRTPRSTRPHPHAEDHGHDHEEHGHETTGPRRTGHGHGPRA